ncbi:hypothetical protein CYMTET_54716 [Cymbomonas tetramitiformis]|uniref:EF-hand domain-containing protein n=1 Tax=Cymbomonas tetramitiformis TaxID=36881 RepID=A0AAE0BEC3_9CHLO|nr:hypothetical protein CYMTET_54716 [Cymbomonas tetramitiformis]
MARPAGHSKASACDLFQPETTNRAAQSSKNPKAAAAVQVTFDQWQELVVECKETVDSVKSNMLLYESMRIKVKSFLDEQPEDFCTMLREADAAGAGWLNRAVLFQLLSQRIMLTTAELRCLMIHLFQVDRDNHGTVTWDDVAIFLALDTGFDIFASNDNQKDLGEENPSHPSKLCTFDINTELEDPLWRQVQSSLSLELWQGVKDKLHLYIG